MIRDGIRFYSVSQLQQWKNCHKLWWLFKVKDVKQEENKYMLRGRLIHETLEHMPKNFYEYAQIHPIYKKLPDDARLEVKNICGLLEHDFKLKGQKFEKEMEIIDEELRMVAYIDVVGDEYIIDYKTSKFWRKVSDDYIIQLKIYSVLYYRKTGKFIKNLGIYYLKDNTIKWFTIEEWEIKQWEKNIKEAIVDIEEHLERDDFKCTYKGKYTCRCKQFD